MRFNEMVSKKGYHISFEKVSEPRLNDISLRIIVIGSKDTTDLIIYPHPDSHVTTYQIDFSQHITYSVTYDDYTIWNDSEKFEGEAFRIYSKSNYFDFVQKELDGIKINDKLIHYSLACHEHQVNIISSVEPIITIINS